MQSLDSGYTTSVGNFIGHHGRCFDLRCYEISSSSSVLLSSSEDGTAKLWDTSTKQCRQSFVHNKKSEVLRSTILGEISSDRCTIGTAGSDGKVTIWNCSNYRDSTEKPQNLMTLSHRNNESQIYACEANVTCPQYLLTGADNELFLWDLSQDPSRPLNRWSFYLDSKNPSSGIHFGGEQRNPDRECFVFDAKWDPAAPNLFSTVLSDNSFKMLDLREKEILCSLNFPQQVYEEEIDQSVTLGHPTAVRIRIFFNLLSVRSFLQMLF